MRKVKFFYLKSILLISIIAMAQVGFGKSALKLIPYPKEIKFTGDDFEVSRGFKIGSVDKKFKESSLYLHSMVKELNADLEVKKNVGGKPIIISINLDKSLLHGSETYHLIVGKEKISVYANSPKGCFHALQTLNQLITRNQHKILLPQVEILDYPNFSWRSYMLDESRYFFGKELVMSLLNELSALKINKFHWHLTDDAGWRIEIKKYPKLTEIGSMRDSSQVDDNGKLWDSQKFDGIPHKGFYTQNDIKEVVAYAKSRGIDIIPEIEMPGHASAAIVSYPWLGIKGEMKSIPVSFGIKEDSYNIAKPEVVAFLHDVLDEVCELFPYEVIHIGGDEVLFKAWSESKVIVEHMKTHNLTGPADAQIKFTNEISGYLESKGKRMMGWNEILGKNVHGFSNVHDFKTGTELSTRAIIHFWRGDIPLIADAAQRGYEIVNSLNSETYLDYSYSTLPLKRIYQFSPIPQGLNKDYEKNIIGVGAQMWTEWAGSSKDVEYKTFPRIAALAEVGWSGSGDYEDFVARLKRYSERWKQKSIHFPSEEIK